MKLYNDGKNSIWFFGGCNGVSKFSNYKKERRILRILVKECYRKNYDPFYILDCFCISDMAQLICDGYASGYFYGEGRFINDVKRLSDIPIYKDVMDVIALDWVVDIYLTARYNLGMTYLEIARKYPAKQVYKRFSPLHETSETNALAKMDLEPSDLYGCIINADFYLYKHEIPDDKIYLLNFESKAVTRKGFINLNEIEFFFKADGVNGYLSNFYPSPFELKGYHFSCVEQYLMWSKATLFRDSEIADEILKESKPAAIKALGRKVKGYEDSLWAAKRYCVAKEGLLAKFSQNSELRERLLATSGNFAECAKNDKIWGIGLGMNDPRRIDQIQWNGQNLLGFALREVYEELKQTDCSV